MSSPLYILCPGQGAQAVGMGRDFAAAHSAAARVFDTAAQVLGCDLLALCANGPEERLNQTDVSQPAIYVTSIACFRAAQAAGVIEPGGISAFAGLSLGEYTALHLAGVFSFEEGLGLVAARGRAMQAAAVAVPSGMVSLMGADESTAARLCADSANGQTLVAANFNAPGQIVVSGNIEACERVARAAEAQGFKAIALKVAGAFHSPLMQSGADAMQKELAGVAFKAPTAPVYSNVTARPHGDEASIKRLLVDQIVKPVRWEQTMRQLADVPDARFVELAPGRVLSGLLKKINRRLPVRTLSTADTLSAPDTPLAPEGLPAKSAEGAVQ
jgi:[acyl-carrier-protein] S-malonyltransferase